MFRRILSGSLLASLFIGTQSSNVHDSQVVLDVDVEVGVADANATYDYVVVGGGTAGLAIAARLAEVYSVAVIEAGSYYQTVNNDSTVPANYINFLNPSMNPSDWSPLDWGFTTTEQTGPGNISYHYARAKTLGGCSAFNAMAYHRGTVGSYSQWAEKVGDDSFKWENFEQYFSKSVNFSIGSDRPENASIPAQASGAFVNGSGPLHVEYPSYATSFGSWAELGMRELGFPQISDFQHGDLNGSQYFPVTINGETGERETSQTSFLNYAVAAGLPITVYNGTMAQKINFDSNKKATNVSVSTNGGATYQISARKEIIVSAGAIQSPQLLMVSGIGPKATLEKFDIEVLSDLPGVGQNMWDHAFFGAIYPTNVETTQRLLEEDFREARIKEYQETRGGMLSTNNIDYVGWNKLPDRASLSNATLTAMAEFPADWPEMEYIVGSMPNPAFPSTYRDYVVFIPILVTPTSRGSITISSANISDQPVIDPNWLGTEVDREMMVASLKSIRDIAATKAIQGGIVGDEIAPGKNVQSDEDILAFIKSTFSTVFHASCTCAMGLETDEMAVLDSKARVYGVTGLRVVDASSFPLLPPGHPISTIYALAEKIADDIKNADARDQLSGWRRVHYDLMNYLF